MHPAFIMQYFATVSFIVVNLTRYAVKISDNPFQTNKNINNEDSMHRSEYNLHENASALFKILNVCDWGEPSNLLSSPCESKETIKGGSCETVHLRSLARASSKNFGGKTLDQSWTSGSAGRRMR